MRGDGEWERKGEERERRKDLVGDTYFASEED